MSLLQELSSLWPSLPALPSLPARYNPWNLPVGVLRWASLGAFALTYLFGTWAVASDATSLAARWWAHYCAWIDRSLRAMFLTGSGKQIIIGQLSAIFVVILLGLVTGESWIYLGLPLTAIGPRVWIMRLRKERVAKLETQLSGFLQILSSSLRATPSIGAALQAIVGVLESPVKEEIGLTLKELKLGSPLDQALLQLSARIGSRSFDTAVSAILVGRMSGGDLPKMLEQNAASLREMHRLDGVLRSKTADARNQLMVMSVVPPLLIVGISIFSADFFAPLLHDVTGFCILGVAMVLWVTALLWGRQIMGVQL